MIPEKKTCSNCAHWHWKQEYGIGYEGTAGKCLNEQFEIFPPRKDGASSMGSRGMITGPEFCCSKFEARNREFFRRRALAKLTEEDRVALGV